MADQFWANDPVAQPPQRGPEPMFTIPDPKGQREEGRDQTRTDIAVEGNDRANQQFTVDQRNKRTDQSMSLADKYSRDKDVAEYTQSLGNFAAGLRTAPNAQGDNALTTLFVKVFDPGSVANVAETEGAQDAQASIEAARARVMKEFGMDGGGQYTAESRARMRREMSSIMAKRNKVYLQRREYFRNQAQGYELDPNLIIGEHAGARFRDEFTAYDQANGEDRKPPDERGPIPGATPENLAFDTDTGTGAFGSQLQADRLTPQQQGALDAFLKANAGNPNFGPDQLSAFYQSMGIQGGAMPSDNGFFEAVRKGEAFGTQPNYEQADAERRRIAMEASFQEVPEGDLTGGYGFDKGLTLNQSDEIRGVIGGLKSLLSGGSFVDGYQSERDIERALQERSRETEGVAPEIIGSILTPVGLVSKGNMVRDGLAMGALAGFGEGEGVSDSLSKTATGAALGGLASKGVEKAVPIVAQSGLGQKAAALAEGFSDVVGRGRDRRIVEFGEAADRQGLDYMAADVPGAYSSQFATATTGMTLGGIPLKAKATKIIEKAKEAKDRIAGNVGVVADNAASGHAAQRGMATWERQTEGRGAHLMEAVPIPNDAAVDLAATRQVLSEINGTLSSNPQLAALVRDPKLVAYERALKSDGLSWQDTKGFRTYVGKIIGKPSLTSDGASDDALRALYGSLSRDMEGAASAHGPEALKAFGRANAYWRGRQARIDDVMSKIVGKDLNLSGEQAAAQLERWAAVKGGDFNKLYRAVRSMPEDEANQVRAHFIDRMGMASKGGQDATQEVFSPDVWMTNWNSISPRAKAILFQGDHRKALDDLATVFSGMKASRAFANPSGTGYSVWGATNAALATANPMAFALSAVAQLGGGALLGSPAVAKWVVKLAQKPNPAAQLAHIDRLTSLARSEPVIANDIFTLQERLAEAFTQPQSLRSAAKENDEVGDAEVRERKSGDANQ